MSWKCTPQVMGLVRGEPKEGQKHRANIRKIAVEAGCERGSKSATLDRKRSHLNRYEGYQSGAKFADDMEREADEYRVKVAGKTKDGQDIIREKGLQKNAVVSWAVIYNPPAEVCASWTDADYQKFYMDSREVMAEIEPRLFRNENIRMSAEHFDEGLPVENSGTINRHVHDLGICKDANGRYCGNLIDSKLMIRINEKYPALMRKRGWDIADLDTTDWQRAKTDKEYATARNAKRRQSGVSVNKYLEQKARETAQKTAEMKAEAAEAVDQAVKRQQTIERILTDKKQRLEGELAEQRAEIQKANNELQETKQRLDTRDKIHKKFIRFIYDIISELGGVRRRFSTYGEAMEAVRTAKDNFTERTKQQAEEAAAAKYQAKEDALEARKSIIDEMAELRGKLQECADTDTSRKRFMQKHKNKAGQTLEELYQASLRKFYAKKDAFLCRGEELAAEYYSIHEQAEQLQR